MPTGSGTTSPTPSNTSNSEKNCGNKLSTASYDPAPYIQRARVTRPAPPKPSVNPMQFVQIKPCNLYQSAHEQLKKAEEVKKVKEIKKEEPEDWQSNLDNWKSSRRKRVEHIIDRVVEVKKLELEEHDRTRRKSKTFSEMLEERGSRKKLSTLAVYNEDESNDLSDLGIGTSSASGKSSLSEDCDNQSVMSDNVDTEKPAYDVDNNSNHRSYGSSRENISSPGYDTSTSTAPASSPDPCEYTYEGAIQDYKTRISRAQTGSYNNGFRSTVSSPYSKDSTPERSTGETFANRRMSGSKIEDRLINFEVKCTTERSSENTVSKRDLPKVDIYKRRELFEKENTSPTDVNAQKRFSGDFSSSKSIRERLSSLEKKNEDARKQIRLSGDISSIKDRLQNLEKQPTVPEKPPKIDVPVVSLKDRLTSLQSAAIKEEVKKPVALVDEHELEVLRKEDLEKQNTLKRDVFDDDNFNISQEVLNIQDESNIDTDREDSGIHTTDVSCSVSQTDEQPELVNEETHHLINEDGLCTTTIEQAEEEESSNLTVPVISQALTEEKSNLASTLRNINIEICKEQDVSSGSPEPPADQEISVSLSLSESPTASIQTVIFNEKLTNDSDGTFVEGSTSSQHVVEGTLGACRYIESSSKAPVVNTNLSLLTSKSSYNSKVDNICNNNISQSFNKTDQLYISEKEANPKLNNNFSATFSPNKSIDGDRHVVYNSKLEKVKNITEKEQVNSNALDEVVKKCQEYLETTKIIKHVGTFKIQEQSIDKHNTHVSENCNSLEKNDLTPKYKTKVVGVKPKSESHERRKTVVEVCEKADVRNLAKAGNVPTSYFDINLSEVSRESVVKETEEALRDTRSTGANIPVLISSRPSSPMNGVIVAKLEVIETTIKVTSSNEGSSKSPRSSAPGSPTSPTINTKTHPATKPKNIFDFLKRNFNPSTDEEDLNAAGVSLNNSKFYVPLAEDKENNEVNIEITRTVKTEKIVEETDSADPESTITSEINQLLDEELSKLTVEDTKL